MRLWRRETRTTPAAPVERAPDPIAVFGIEGVIEGSIAWQERRLSDSLNAGEPLLVQAADAAGWEELDPDQVIAVAAPPRDDPKASAIPRRRHAVELDAGPYRFSGVVHMPVGADPARFVRSTPQRWLPLTHCTVASPSGEWEVEVVIVNLEHVVRR